MPLTRIGAGQYETKDQRFLIERDCAENECNCIHCSDGRQFDLPK